MKDKDMKKKKGFRVEWIIYALIILIFLVALVIAINRLMEWNSLQKEMEWEEAPQAKESASQKNEADGG